MEQERRSGRERRRTSRFHLTPREVQVLSLVLAGEGNKHIAAELGITEQAIKEHVSTLLDKFDVPNRAALAEAGARLEFSGEPGIDRSWMRELFLDAQPLIAIMRGPDLRFEAANEAFSAAVAHRPLIGRTVREAFPEAPGQEAIAVAESVFATGVPSIAHEIERRWDRGNGIEARILDQVIQPLHDGDGRVNGIVSFAVDVTDEVERRRHAELLREEYAAVLDQVPSGVVVLDAEGRIVRINDAARRIARIPADTTRSVVLARDVFRMRHLDGTPVPPDALPSLRALKGEQVPPTDLAFAVGDEVVGVRTTTCALRDPDGTIRGVLTVFTELWTRRRT